MNESEISFEVKSGMKNIIGRDLIIDDNIAIFELVKNSYDAHAKKVVIIFEDDKIIISDDGKGMSQKDLKQKWFAVAYSAKHDGTEDDDVKKDSHLNNLKSKRFYAGAKGIGRFSCDRLGSDLVLTTSKINETEINQVNVDWSKFEIDEKENFQNIKIPYQTLSTYKINFPNDSKHGTILEISKFSTKWDVSKIRNLKFSLEKLINPFSKNDNFNIEIICEKYKITDFGLNERQKINGLVNNSILDILNLKTTQLDLVIDNNIITTKLIDRGNLIYHIEEPNIYFPVINDLRINLYFLNRSAKIHFGKLMDIEPVNYGNVFLFKNGFRVQPYGNTNDDSWGLDNRKQQGYNRFLGTRDLFGRVDIITENFEEFKEVSSRDGGLVETLGYNKLIEAFWEKSLKRLERYVVGVLWGEAFLRKKYFKTENEGQNLRLKLDKDKDSEDYSTAASNLGSKLDFVNLIKGLSDDDNIKIIEYDKKLVDFVNEQIDVVQPKFLKDLEKIAEKTNDNSLLNQIRLTEDNFKKLEKDKENAEKRALEEELKRKEAEKRAEEAEKKRIEAEKKSLEEERKRKEAELATERKEKERLQAELNKIKAEQKAKEEEERRKQAEITADNRKKQIDRFRSSESIEYKDLRDSNHIIGVYSDDISKKIQLFKRKLDKSVNFSKEEILSFLQGISLANEKISTITRFTTKSNFLEASLSLNEDMISYLKNYLVNIYGLLHKDIKIDIIENQLDFIREFQPIELLVAIDNILSNSRKKDAKKIIFEFEKLNENLLLSVKDVGKVLDNKIDSNLIFEEGITSTKGAGLGLSHVKRIMENDLNASIEYNPNYKEGFELKILFKK